jgi:aryl-alcohol dehydrogenase-like predicted oxidoreductase
VNLGDTGLRVSRLCLGMMSYGAHESRAWALDEATSEPIIRRAVEGGITFFDTADVYNGGQSEVVTGRSCEALRHARGVRRRDEGARQTMPGENGRGLSRKHILASIDASLERLGSTTSTSTRSTAGTRDADRGDDGGAARRRQAGKARYIGASSMYAWQFAKAQSRRADAFVSMQNHYNLSTARRSGR